MMTSATTRPHGVQAPDVSIITPHFNTPAEFFDACVESILTQEGCNLEWIIADDGSASEFLARIHACASQDRRVTVLECPHQGASAARNRALEQAHGTYVTFVDADDRLLPGILEQLLSHATQTQVDVLYSYLDLDHGSHTVAPRLHGPDALVEIGPELIADFRTLILAGEPPASLASLSGLQNSAVAGKLYRRSLIDGLAFDTRMAYGEDALWNVMAVHRAASVAVWQKTTYIYTVHETATTRAADGHEFVRIRDHRHFNEHAEAEGWDASDTGLRFAKSLHGALVVGASTRSPVSLAREVAGIYRDSVSDCLERINLGRYLLTPQKRLLFAAMQHRSTVSTVILAYLLGIKRRLEHRRNRRR